MDYKEFFAQVKAGGLRGAYLFEGTEEYVKASALAAVEKALLPPGMEQLNEAVLENPAADALIAAAETLPEAVREAYRLAEGVRFANRYCRKDIGAKALKAWED